MACAQCGTTNQPGAKFCVECGTPLTSSCPSCGSAVLPGAKFCPECGTRLGALDVAPSPAPPVPRPTPVAATERRIVSVLFADLVGFTTLAEGRDSEAVRDLLSRYFDRASEVVARYGGTVEKFIGDAVMAVWGTPITHEDDAERSVRAALGVLDAVRELGQEAGVDGLSARAGVTTGEATVTLGAQNQGMVAGDIVNTASRLQSAALPGTVHVDASTRGAAEGAIAFEPVGEQALKGKALSVEAFRAVRVVGTVRGAIRVDALEPPFVGRETEFRLLRDVVHATGRERRARLVSLTGQGGIGKSRLAWEFHKYLDGISEVVWWHHGRSPAYGEGVTFWALGEMIRKRAGLAEADDDATSRERIAASIAEHVPDAEERQFVEPALLALLGLDEPPPGGRDRLFAGWRLFLERLSESATVILVFEDLQWADDGLLDFIEHVLEWSRSYPILVVTLARPELLDRRATWGSGSRAASSLQLGPLSDADMRALLAGLVPGLPEAAVRSILDRADGIPLYAVETVRMLISDGRLEPDGEGRFRPTGRLQELEVPSTLQALIAARLDGLDAADRSLLQDASILGKTFTVEALAAVTGIDPDALRDRLRGLVARELLVLDTNPASPERGQYGFVQALIREVAYATLARRDRRTRHLAAARYFEARGDDELVPVLANHYLSAYRAAPDGPEGDAVRAQARIALRAAGERAAALGSYGGAASYLEQALELAGGDPAEEADLLERAGSAADFDGQYERAIGLLERAVDRRRSLDDPVATGESIGLLGLALLNGGHADRAIELLEQARLQFGAPELALARAPIVARIGQLYIRRGQGMPAVQAAEEALPEAERTRRMPLLLDALVTKASGLAHSGRAIEGIALMDGALRLARDHGLVAIELRALNNTLVLQIDVDPWRALHAGLEAVDQIRRYGAGGNLIFAVVNTVEIAIRTGEWARADDLLRSTLALELDPVDRVVVEVAAATLRLLRSGDEEAQLSVGSEAAGALAIANLEDFRALRAFLLGDFAEARRASLAAAATDDLNGPVFYERAGRCALWMGDLAGASEDLRRFRAIGRSAAFPAAQLRGLEAGVLALEGRRAEAVDAYRDTARRYRDLRVAFDGAIYQLDAARFLGIDTPEGAAAAEEARAVFERLGAAPLLARLEGLRTTGPANVRRAAAVPARETSPA